MWEVFQTINMINGLLDDTSSVKVILQNILLQVVFSDGIGKAFWLQYFHLVVGILIKEAKTCLTKHKLFGRSPQCMELG